MASFMLSSSSNSVASKTLVSNSSSTTNTFYSFFNSNNTKYAASSVAEQCSELKLESPPLPPTTTATKTESCCVKKLCKNLLNVSTTSNMSASSSCSLLYNNSFVNLFGVNDTNTRKLEPPSLLVEPKGCSSSQFIEVSELKSKFLKLANQITQNMFIILLDCRSYNDFNSKRIKDSVHLNCRDKLSKKRLLTRKITVRDLISSENIKNKFDLNNNSNNSSCDIDEQQQENVNNSNSSSSAKMTDNLDLDEKKSNEDLIILYDDKTSDLDDLQSESNPLKIVQDNIKQCGFNKDCRILKGGFKQFSEICPEYVEEVNKLKLSNNLNSKYYDMQVDQHQSSIDNAQLTKIEPFLYLGNEMDAKNMAKLESEGIFHILNVTKNIPFYDQCVSDASKSKFVFKRISVNDTSDQNLRQHFDEAFQFIDDAVRNNSKVLVHCQAGVSRSPTIVIAYLMYKQKLRMDPTYNRVREMRPIVAPNLIFMSQLMDFEAQLFPGDPANTSNRFCASFSLTKSSFSSLCSSIGNETPTGPMSSVSTSSNDTNSENSSKTAIACN